MCIATLKNQHPWFGSSPQIILFEGKLTWNLPGNSLLAWSAPSASDYLFVLLLNGAVEILPENSRPLLMEMVASQQQALQLYEQGTIGELLLAAKEPSDPLKTLYALSALRKFPKQALDLLSKTAENPDPMIRFSALTALTAGGQKNQLADTIKMANLRPCHEKKGLARLLARHWPQLGYQHYFSRQKKLNLLKHLPD